jgi:hypothetical protein
MEFAEINIGIVSLLINAASPMLTSHWQFHNLKTTAHRNLIGDLKDMTRIHRYFILLVAGLVIGLTSCSPQTETPPSPSPQTSATPSAEPEPRAESPSPTPKADGDAASSSAAANPKTVSATIYKVDNQCLDLVPEKVPVAADRPVDSAVSQVLAEQSNTDFDLSGYRVNVKDGVATVDLRMNPDSKRQLESLSSCEQLALFGSLRKTLTSNPQWKISTVRFTEGGEEVAL